MKKKDKIELLSATLERAVQIIYNNHHLRSSKRSEIVKMREILQLVKEN